MVKAFQQGGIEEVKLLIEDEDDEDHDDDYEF